MSATALSLALAAGSVLSMPSPPPLRAAASNASRRLGLPDSWRRAAVTAIGIAAVGVLLAPSAWWWWPTAPVVGLVVSRLPQRRAAGGRAADRAQLAVHADLLAACLEAGLSMPAALSAVAAPSSTRPPARAAPGGVEPLAGLSRVAALLLLGTDPDRAWLTVADDPDLAGLAAAARRSAAGGAVVAVAVREHAAALRAAAAQAAEQAAGRAGIAMTAPLGGCFLPAFLCLGLAPVVVGLLSTLHLF